MLEEEVEGEEVVHHDGGERCRIGGGGEGGCVPVASGGGAA